MGIKYWSKKNTQKIMRNDYGKKIMCLPPPPPQNF